MVKFHVTCNEETGFPEVCFRFNTTTTALEEATFRKFLRLAGYEHMEVFTESEEKHNCMTEGRIGLRETSNLAASSAFVFFRWDNNATPTTAMTSTTAAVLAGASSAHDLAYFEEVGPNEYRFTGAAQTTFRITGSLALHNASQSPTMPTQIVVINQTAVTSVALASAEVPDSATTALALLSETFTLNPGDTFSLGGTHNDGVNVHELTVLSGDIFISQV